jgi:hypothetical protein
MTQEVKPQDHPDFIGGWVWTELESRWIEERIAEAILAEREACAKVCDDIHDKHEAKDVFSSYAEAIRVRGNIASIIACRDMLDAQPIPNLKGETK